MRSTTMIEPPPHSRAAAATDMIWRVAPNRAPGTLLDQIGQTPLLRLARVTADLPAAVEVWVKAEWFNPGGSVKDRAALRMVEEAERRGHLRPDKVLIDATSGNTGIAYALIGAIKGYQVELVMPANVSLERKALVRAYGARLIESDPLEGSDGAIRLARQMVAQDPRATSMWINTTTRPTGRRTLIPQASSCGSRPPAASRTSWLAWAPAAR